MADIQPGLERAAGSFSRSIASSVYYQGFGDVSHLMWPTYNRLTVRRGGDVKSGFHFTDQDDGLEYWLDEGLGQHFEESFEGQVTFAGRLHTVRLVYENIALVTSLDTVFNTVACYYTSLIGNTTALTQFYTDDKSINKWGVRVLIIRPSDYTTQSEAEATAQQVLDVAKDPQIHRGPISLGGTVKGTGRVELSMEGYASTMDAERYNEATEDTEEIGIQMAGLATGASLVTLGKIDDNTKAVSIQAEYRPKLQRAHWLADQSDSQGRSYYYGCYGSKAFTYRLTPEEVRMVTRVRQLPILVFDEKNGDHIPAPLVKPWYYSRAEDILSNRPFKRADPLHDPRVQLDMQVKYSRAGVQLIGREWTARDRGHAILMKVIGENT